MIDTPRETLINNFKRTIQGSFARAIGDALSNSNFHGLQHRELSKAIWLACKERMENEEKNYDHERDQVGKS